MSGRAMVVAAVSLLAACGPSPRGTLRPAPRREPFIDTLALRAHTYFLAQDALAGRGTGAPGADVAALYIAAACREMGLRPAGQDFFQEVPLVAAALDSATLTLRTDGNTVRFHYPEDFLPDFAGEQALTNVAGPVVFAGNRLDLAALSGVTGAVVVTTGPVGERTASDSLARRGTLALLQLVPDSHVYNLYRASRGPARLRLAEPGIVTSLQPALPWLIGAPQVGRALDTEGTRATLALELHVTRRSVGSRNVACVLPGSVAGTRDTAIVFTAHYDHLGLGAPDAAGDSIYNGFSDNAAGVAMLLAIARAMTGRPGGPLRHSVIFLFPTAEEQGLLGSDYYVARPLWPLGRTAGVITLDAGAPPAPPTSWRIAGGDRTPFGALAMDVALAHGWSATTSPATPNSDYYPFARSGVPAVFLIPGPGPYEGLSSDSSVALRRAWDHYHQPGDAWDADFPFRGLARYAEYAYFVARALDRR